MKKKTLREKIEIIGGIGLIAAGVLAWSWFIWALGGHGMTSWQKLLSILISYAVIAMYLWLGDRGFGAVPVKVIYIERAK